tara:strand:+ start:706 stop:2793 length:2088 start_codon:yes stop_codon:yes gene_type:complete
MTNSYNFQGGTFDPVEQVDVIPEQQALNNKIERSEQEYFDSLRENDRNRINDSQKLFAQLGTLSKSIQGFAAEKAKKKREEDEARGAMNALTSDYNYEDLQNLLNEEEVMKSQDIQLAKIGTDIENETGRFTLGEEVRGMSGWERYSFVKTVLQREGKDYHQYKRTAKDSVSITINDGNGDIKVGYGEDSSRPPQNEAEADAVDAKIKFEFVKRFAGVNPTLLQATVKGEIDRVDNADRAARAAEFDAKAKEQKELNERLSLVEDIRSNPENGRAAVEHYVETNKFKYNGNVGMTRLALADTLVDAVENGDMSLTEALATVQHGIPHRGTKKDEDMTVFKEWNDLETRLMEANTSFRERTEDFKKDAMLADIEEFNKVENPTVETRAGFVKYLRTTYPDMAIPEEGYNIVYGYKDDDAIKQVLESKRAANGGFIVEKDLEGASPTIQNSYRDRNLVRPNGNEPISSVSQLGQKNQKFIRDRVANALTLELGEGKATTLEFDTLYENAEQVFIQEYNLSLGLQGDPSTALKQGQDAMLRVLDKDDWRRKNSQRKYTEDDFDRQKALGRAFKQIKPATGNWRVIKLDVPETELEELQVWAEGDGKGPVPSYYNHIAFKSGIYPKVLASAQASLYGFKAPTVDEKKLEKIPPSVRRLLIIASPESINIAKKVMEDEENKENEEYIPSWKQRSNLRVGV